MNQIEFLVLSSLMQRETYLRKVIPYLKEEYFQDTDGKVILSSVKDFLNKYNSTPTAEAIIISLDTRKDITESAYEQITGALSKIKSEQTEDHDLNWLVDETEKFCRDRAIYNGLMRSVQIATGESSREDKGMIPKILTDALAVTFDPNIGHDFVEDSENRYAWYHRVEDKIPFDLEYMNKITSGGLSNKTLNIFMAGTGVGKSLVMCHIASSFWSAGKNVLYITMEMSEERIAERIDANILNMDIAELGKIPYAMYERRINLAKGRTKGGLIIKEFPTASAHVGHFRHLLNELKLKKKFVPDVIFIDYLNICCSSRIKGDLGSVNSYTFVKAIVEEIRGLAVEFNLPIISATQTNRAGNSDSDVDITNTSESFGTSQTVDLQIAVISSDELEANGQFMFKQLKNRYNDLALHKRFVVGVDKSKMKLFDVEASAQDEINKTDISAKSSDPYADGAFLEREKQIKSENRFSGFKI